MQERLSGRHSQADQEHKSLCKGREKQAGGVLRCKRQREWVGKSVNGNF